MSTTNWAEFQNDVRSVLNVDRIDPVVPATVDSRRTIWNLALVVLVISLGIAIYFSKPNTQLDTSTFKQTQAAQVAPVDNVQTLRQDIDSLNLRVRILGVISNNNWASSNQKDIVFIGRDWKMSQIPSNIQKTEADAKFFQDWTQQ